MWYFQYYRINFHFGGHLLNWFHAEREENKQGFDKIDLNSCDCLLLGLHLAKYLLARISIPEKSPHLVILILAQ